MRRQTSSPSKSGSITSSTTASGLCSRTAAMAPGPSPACTVANPAAASRATTASASVGSSSTTRIRRRASVSMSGSLVSRPDVRFGGAVKKTCELSGGGAAEIQEETSMGQQLTQTAQWQALADHREKFGATHLRELFAADAQRAAKHTLAVGDLTVDLSKNL